MIRKNNNLGKALFVSLAFHAAVLSLQFDVPGRGLPWLRMSSSVPRATLPRIQAMLLAPPLPIVPPPIVAIVNPIVEPLRPPAPKSPPVVPKSFAANFERPPIKVVNPPAKKLIKKPAKTKPVLREMASPPARPAVAVLSTPKQTPWRVRAGQLVQKDVTPNKDVPPVIETHHEKKPSEPDRDIAAEIELKKKEARKKAEEQALVQAAEAEVHKKAEALAAEEKRKQAQAALIKVAEEAQERRKAEALVQVAAEEKRKADQAAQAAQVVQAKAAEELREHQRLEALAKVAEEKRKEEQAILKTAEEAQERQRIEALAQARVVEEKRRQEQLALSRAAEEAQEIKKAEALAQAAVEEKTRIEQAAQAKAAEDVRREELAAQARVQQVAQARAAQAEAAAQAQAVALAVASRNDSGKQGGVGKQGVRGADLASRAVNMAKGGLSGLPIKLPDLMKPLRRASILGRNPSDVDLDFYGNSFEQKVVRIGNQNLPRLSKNRSYEPLLVSVTINSNGTVAGVRIIRSSGSIDIDNAVRHIVEISQPFAVFPLGLRRNYDSLDVTRTWIFDDNQRLVLGP